MFKELLLCGTVNLSDCSPCCFFIWTKTCWLTRVYPSFASVASSLLSICAALTSVLLFLLLIILSTGSRAGRWPAGAWCWSLWRPKRKDSPSWWSTVRKWWSAPCWWRTSCWLWRSDVCSDPLHTNTPLTYRQRLITRVASPQFSCKQRGSFVNVKLQFYFFV